MRVRHGWSGETSSNRWAKFDLELEEEDLRRLLTSKDLPASTVDTLSLNQAFRLLEIEAERLVLVKLAARFGYDPAEARSQIKELAAESDTILAPLRERVGQ